MELKKYRYVIEPQSIGVPQDFNLIAVSKTSPFDNGYDMKAAAELLGEKIETGCSEKDPDYEQWQIFKAHESLLKGYLKNKAGRMPALRWGEYEILPSENARFKGLGGLVNKQSDAVFLHTKQAVRMWEGRQAGLGNFIGVRSGALLFNELARYALADNPFAQMELCRLEKELEELEQYYQSVNVDVQNHLERIAGAGISVSLLQNEEPAELHIGSIKGYSFQLLRILIEYDLFIRSIKTIAIKGMQSNRKTNRMMYEGGKALRRFIQTVLDVTKNIRTVRHIKKEDLLQADVRQELLQAIHNGKLPLLSREVLLNEQVPSLLYINSRVNEVALQNIVELAQKDGLLEAV